LWSDELYSVGKSFQPSLGALVEMLREDTHPPFYYFLLWVWGQLIGQTPVTLRLFSWCAYCLGGIVMVRQSLATGGRNMQVLTVAALLAFCSPYPVRFAIEGKSYALLLLMVALAWWCRRSQRPLLYALVSALAGITHFYGLFLVLAAAVWDGLKGRTRFALAALMAALPGLGWIVYAADYLFSSRAASWIGPPDYALLEETLARGLGLWPLPKLGLILLLLVVLRRWGGLQRLSWPEPGVLDRSGLTPSLLMVVGVVLVSFVKPMAFSRYFVVLVPAVLPVLAVQFGALNLNRLGRGCAVGVLGVLLASWWGPGFAELDPALGGVREQDQFRLISQRTGGLVERYGPRARLLNLSDRMEVAMGRIPSDPVPWGDADDLEKRLAAPPLPSELWLASSGPSQAMERKLKPLQSQVVQAGYNCDQRANDLSHARLLRCRFEAMGRSE
jgi:uncharacterized membrane protein